MWMERVRGWGVTSWAPACGCRGLGGVTSWVWLGRAGCGALGRAFLMCYLLSGRMCTWRVLNGVFHTCSLGECCHGYGA